MKLRWIGHACFLLQSNSGIRVLMDPFHEKMGLPLPDVEADIVTISHEHPDHNSIHRIRGEYTLLNRSGTFTKTVW
jgi:L-ascorbate metabolism protein UlaG (beta-lactamase superfamily)